MTEEQEAWLALPLALRLDYVRQRAKPAIEEIRQRSLAREQVVRSRTREQNRIAARAYRQRNQAIRTCEHCDKKFSTHKRGQRFCSRSHANYARYAGRKEQAA